VNVAAAALASLLLTLPASVQTRRLLIGRSVEGRRIEAVELGDPHSHYKLLVVGCIRVFQNVFHTRSRCTPCKWSVR